MINFEIKNKLGELPALLTKKVTANEREIMHDILENHTGVSYFCLEESPYCIKVTGTRETDVLRHFINLRKLQTELFCYVDKTRDFFRKENYKVSAVEQLLNGIVAKGCCSFEYVDTDGKIKQQDFSSAWKDYQLVYRFGNVYVPFYLSWVVSSKKSYNAMLDTLKRYSENGLDYDNVFFMKDADAFCNTINEERQPRNVVFCIAPKEENLPLIIQLGSVSGSGAMRDSLTINME